MGLTLAERLFDMVKCVLVFQILQLVVVLKWLVLGESFAECTMGAQVPLLRCVFVDMVRKAGC